MVFCCCCCLIICWVLFFSCWDCNRMLFVIKLFLLLWSMDIKCFIKGLIFGFGFISNFGWMVIFWGWVAIVNIFFGGIKVLICCWRVCNNIFILFGGYRLVLLRMSKDCLLILVNVCRGLYFDWCRLLFIINSSKFVFVANCWVVVFCFVFCIFVFKMFGVFVIFKFWFILFK